MRKAVPLLLALIALGVALLPGARPAAANPLIGVVVASAGAGHTCALTLEGGVKCWGANNYGQVGNGDPPNNVTTAVSVCADAACSAPLAGVAAISAGASHTCAVTAAGTLACWGLFTDGQLGPGVEPHPWCDFYACSPTPVPVCQVYDDVAGECAHLLSGVRAVSAGGAHTCALMADRRVRCWGGNWAGQLGDGTTGSHRSTPADVLLPDGQPLAGVLALAAGDFHTCVLMTDGTVKCWGGNASGQLGDGEACGRTCSTPVDVCQVYDDITGRCSQPFSGAIAITAGGDHTCALMAHGAVMCWGRNAAGQLGDGTTDHRATPVDVLGLQTGVSAVEAGFAHTCAATADGRVKCWGYNILGQLGDGTGGYGQPHGDATRRPIPAEVCLVYEAMAGECEQYLFGVTAVAAGFMHSCAIATVQERASPSAPGVKCWGDDEFGQVGGGRACHSAILSCFTPVDVVGDAPKPPPGDADCDGTVSSLDALLVLQFDAALIASLPCPDGADVNADSAINSLDAVLILQHAAGLRKSHKTLTCPHPKSYHSRTGRLPSHLEAWHA